MPEIVIKLNDYFFWAGKCQSGNKFFKQIYPFSFHLISSYSKWPKILYMTIINWSSVLLVWETEMFWGLPGGRQHPPGEVWRHCGELAHSLVSHGGPYKESIYCHKYTFSTQNFISPKNLFQKSILPTKIYIFNSNINLWQQNKTTHNSSKIYYRHIFESHWPTSPWKTELTGADLVISSEHAWTLTSQSSRVLMPPCRVLSTNTSQPPRKAWQMAGQSWRKIG